MEVQRIFSRESLDELSETIDQHNRSMVQAETMEERDELLRQLRGYIIQYLYLVPHRGKFNLVATARVLAQSVQEVDDFDPREAKDAFEELAKYAHNLLEQPWRREFYKISLVSGFWVHNIRARLVDAQDMLVALGYASTDAYTMQILQAPDEELLFAFSRDCYVASHECLILSQIWERVQREVPNNPLTLLEAWEVRKAYASDVDSVCTTLLVHARQRSYEREEAEKVERKRREHEEFQEKLARADLAPPPEVPVEKLIDYAESGEEEIVKKVLSNTEKESHLPRSRGAKEEPIKRGLGGQQPSSSSPYLNGQHTPAVNGYVSSSPHAKEDGQNSAEELDRMIMQMYLAGHVPSGSYRPTVQREESPYYSSIMGEKRDYAFTPLLNNQQSEASKSLATAPATSALQSNGELDRDSTEEEYSMLHDAMGMVGTVKGRLSRPSDSLATPRPGSEPMDISPPRTTTAQGSPSNVSTSSGFKSLNRKQDLPKSSFSAECDKKPSTGEKLLTMLTKGNKSPKGKEKQLPSTVADVKVVPGTFPLEITKVPNPELAASSSVNTNATTTIKLYSEKLVDETDALSRMELDEGEELPSILEATTAADVDRSRGEEWDCKFCTFKNPAPHRICLMCSKSKDFQEDSAPPESPPPPSKSKPKPKSNSGGGGSWTNVISKKKNKNSKSSKMPAETEWPVPAPLTDVATSAVYDTARVRATAEARKAGSVNKAKDRETPSLIAGADADPATEGDTGNKIACEKCTYLNSCWSKECEVCDAPLSA